MPNFHGVIGDVAAILQLANVPAPESFHLVFTVVGGLCTLGFSIFSWLLRKSLDRAINKIDEIEAETRKFANCVGEVERMGTDVQDLQRDYRDFRKEWADHREWLFATLAIAGIIKNAPLK